MPVSALIISLGSSPDPIIKTIDSFQPEIICCLASQGSVTLYGQIQSTVCHKPVDGWHLILTADHESFGACYEAALNCLRIVTERGCRGNEILVDITGGTKVMSAGLAAATMPEGCQINYVSGSRREKDGLGAVCTGTEYHRTEDSIYNQLAIEEHKGIVLFFQRAHFSAARTLADQALAKARPDQQVYFKALTHVLEGFELWDRFDHRAAYRLLDQGARELTQYRQICRLGKSAFLDGIHADICFLARLLDESGGGKRLCRLSMIDLIANAERRALEGFFDDAVARLYRAIEMQAQIALVERGIQTNDVSPEAIPPTIRDELLAAHKGRDGRIRLPLQAAYRMLDAFGDPVGKAFMKDCRINGLLNARNSSILAHGFQPVKQDTYSKLLAITLSTARIDVNELPKLPKIDI